MVVSKQSIVGWELVLADGSIRNVNANDDPELAVALRGSGSTLGIVYFESMQSVLNISTNSCHTGIATEFTVQTHPIGEVWGGMKIYDGSKADEIYAALHEYVPGNSDEQESAIILTEVTAVGSAKIFLVFYFFDGPDPPQTGPLFRFLKIKSILDTTGTKSYSKLVSLSRIFCKRRMWLMMMCS